MAKAQFASTADTGDKNVSFDEIGPGLYAYTAEGDPNSGVIVGDEPGWARTMREIGTVIRSDDAREGPLAFAEKRQPVWKAR